jgi:hypothetical protein
MVAQAAAILEQASALPPGHGLLIRVGALSPLVQPALRARDQFYRLRREMAPAYSELQFLLSQSHPDHEIIIVRRSPAEHAERPEPEPHFLSPEDIDL